MFTSNQKCGAGMLAIFCATTILGWASPDSSRLNPGATILMHSANEPIGASLIAANNFSFTSTTFTGTLRSEVWANDQSNPWGGLTFSYRLSNTGDCSDSLGLFTLGGFGNARVNVNYSGSGIAPIKATRSETGAAIEFEFLDRHGDEDPLPGCASGWPGSTSAWLVIQTDSHSWGMNRPIRVDSQDVPVEALAPLVVPEPTVGALVVVASALVVGTAKRRKV